jgi:hypothetical protein
MILLNKNFAKRDYISLNSAESKYLKKTRKELADKYRKLRKQGPFKPLKEYLDNNREKALEKAKKLAGMETIIPESEQEIAKHLPQNYYIVKPKDSFFKRNKKAISLATAGTVLAGAGIMAYNHYKNKKK